MKKDDRLIYLILTAQQTLRNHLNSALVAGGVKATIAQNAILFLLKQKDGRTMTELSRILSIDNSTLTGLTDRLEKAGFVRRSANPGDRRSSHICITEEGIAQAEAAKIIIHRVNDKIKEGFTAGEVDSFKAVLNAFSSKFA
jgi:DNA-binding MarR family transcriptional regulator